MSSHTSSILPDPPLSLGTALSLVSSSLVLAALPIFMVGGLAVQIRSDLQLSEAALGGAVTVSFLVGSLTAPLGGRLADRIGSSRSMMIGAVLASFSLIGLATVASDWWSLALVLSVAGLSVAITDPGLAILVGRIVRPDRHGLAFGVKEASIPTATLVAGLAVPAIALTVGWRWAFTVGLVPLLVIAVVLPRIRDASSVVGVTSDETGSRTESPPRRERLLLIAVAVALGSAAASGVGVFLTESAVAMGSSEAGAGIILAVGSVAGIITRVAVGVRADRTGGVQFRLIASMLAVGALTMGLGGIGNVGLLVLGTVGAFTGGWAWTGILFLSLVKLNPGAPGASAGLGTASLGAGNAAGPLLFGLAAQTWSFPAAWGLAALAAGLASMMMFRASRL